LREAGGDLDGVEGREIVGVEEGEGVSAVVDSDHADWKRHHALEALSFRASVGPKFKILEEQEQELEVIVKYVCWFLMDVTYCF
jgi:hypothetical protein